MTREQEIKILASLKGDTYFAQYFRDDIDRMCENIKNDYPIECGCEFTKSIEEAAQEYTDELAREREKLTSLIRTMAADGLLQYWDSDTYAALRTMVGQKAIVWAKVDAKVDLLFPEIQWLCGQVGIDTNTLKK